MDVALARIGEAEAARLRHMQTAGAIREAERIHGSENRELDTIWQEAGNCRLYEKWDTVPQERRGSSMIG